MEMLFQFLDTNGDGSGTTNASGNYSVTPGVFFIRPPNGDVYSIYRMLVYVEDAGAFAAEEYGAIPTLTNGVLVQKHDANGLVTDLTGGKPVKSNAQWSRTCYDMQEQSFGTGNNHIAVRWTFSKAGSPVVLDGTKGEFLRVLLNDDLSGLVEHNFFVQGLRGHDGEPTDSYRNTQTGG